MAKVFALFSQLLTCNSNELTTQKVSDPHNERQSQHLANQTKK